MEKIVPRWNEKNWAKKERDCWEVKIKRISSIVAASQSQIIVKSQTKSRNLIIDQEDKIKKPAALGDREGGDGEVEVDLKEKIAISKNVRRI
jgi:hypothetical protein